MTLATGSRIGVYEVVAPLGAGGMGEVYRARDTQLKREVALKVLPEAFAVDPERLARFQREAELLATLNHPNIATVYGLERAEGSIALIMELVEGETLEEIIARGPLAPGDALPIAREIASALEAAHEKGVIHRDLKPANIKITPERAVKVLDFGLAKILESQTSSSSLSMSPTLSLHATHAGVILGTAAYMSPEQARGRMVDRRTDIWAFGCVLYEMLTGARPFDGEDLADVIGAVIHKPVDWTRLPATTPATVRTVLQRCLEKDPKQRMRDMGDVQLALSGAFDSPATPVAAGLSVGAPRWRRAAVAAAYVAAGIAAGSLALWFALRPDPPRVVRTTIAQATGAELSIDGNDRDLAITPDGSRILYGGANGQQLFIRALDQLTATPIASTFGRALGAGAQGIFTSPDGQWVGYIDNNVILKKVTITGGPPVTIIEAVDGNSRGMTWLPDDTIVFATSSLTTGLQRVSAGGGAPSSLTKPDTGRGEADHLWPEALPGGTHILFTIAAATGGLDGAQIALLDLATGRYRTLVAGGTHAHYVSSGHLVYAVSGTLRAVPFDLSALEVRGTPVPVVSRVLTSQVGAADFVVSADGTLVYVDSSASGGLRSMVWVDRKGVETPIPIRPGVYQHPRLSPDGTRVAVTAISAGDVGDIWILDLARGSMSRLTSDPAADNFPVWMPDSRRLIFSSARAGSAGSMFMQNVDGTSAAQSLHETAKAWNPTGITPDGTQVLFHEGPLDTAGGRRDIGLLSLSPGSSGTSRLTALIATPFEDRNGILSPDGRWLAYEADTSGDFEIYVRPYPNIASGQWPVSTGGGRHPLWARDGGELFFIAPDGSLMGVSVDKGKSTWSAGNPARILETRALFTSVGTVGRYYDVAPDGQRFLMLKQDTQESTAPPQIVVVQNWLEELKRLVPVK